MINGSKEFLLFRPAEEPNLYFEERVRAAMWSYSQLVEGSYVVTTNWCAPEGLV